MFVDVQTFLFDAARYAQTVDLVETLEDDEAHAGCPGAHYDGTEQLCQEEAGAEAIEPSFAGAEEACQDGACETSDTVYRGGTYGVVDVQHLVDEVDGKDHQHTADGTDEGGSSG